MGQLTSLDDRDIHEVFIETGYGWGWTLDFACTQPFRRLYCVEIDPGVAAKAAEKWRKETTIEIIRGDSRDVLPTIVNPAVPTTFWLDAHYSDGIFGEAQPPDNSPLIGELEFITSLKWRAPHTILIDDVRLMGTEQGWPTRDQVIDAMPGYTVHQTGDLLVSRP